MANENVDRMLKHLFDGSDWNVYEDSILNLGVGAPGTDLLENCCNIFQKATEHRLKFEREKNSSYLFQYGPTSGPLETRSMIAEYLSKMYGSEVKREDLIVTTGASQGLHFILSTLLDWNGFVFADEVTYMIALDAIKQFSTLTIVPVRLNDDGVDIEDFERLLKQHQFKSKDKEFWGMYYAIPTFHNPTGILFSPAVCRQLIAVARKYDILIICDDVYNLLNYKDAQSPKRLFAYDSRDDSDYRGNVISNGSFSKIISPGLRMGWLEVPARIKSNLDSSGIINSGGCFNNYTSGIVASLFEMNLAQEHIEMMHTAYKERMLATCDILKSQLPKSCSLIVPEGGYFIWIRMPETKDANEFLKFCVTEEKIFFIPGRRFAVVEGTAKNCFRISIAFHSTSKLVDGAKRLCSALKRFLEE